MTREVAIAGPLPEALAAVFKRAGIREDPDAVVVVVASVSRGELQKLVAGDRMPVVVVEDRAAAVEALAAGAIDVITPPWDERRVVRTLAPLLRSGRQFRRRLDAHQRRTQRALDDLQSTRDLLGRLIDATPNPVMAADPRGRVLVFNQAAEASLGYESEWVRTQMNVTDIYADPGDARRVITAIRQSEEGLVNAFEVRLRARSGEHIPVALSAAEVYGSDGQPMATVGVFQDRRMELALRSRLEETTEQLIATELRAAAQDVGTALAHELNQSLTTAMGIIEILELDPGLSDRIKERLARCNRQHERMTELVRSLARTSRPGATGYGDTSRVLEFPTDEI